MQGSTSFRLIVRRGPQPNQVYELNKGIITLGRDITNDIVINDPEVSRHHSRLTQGGGGFTFEDLGSTNGTFINGQRLTGARPLSNGDMIGLGETVTLAYEVVGAGAPAEAPHAATMVGGSPQAGPAAYAPPAAPVYNQQPSQQQPQAGYASAAAPQQPYGTPPQGQQPMAYEYDYQEEPYEGGGVGRWVILGCGCFLVLCIVTSVIGVIIIDSQCWWDNIPVISETFDLGVKPGACE
ncbi:MAG: FHA domain-containing protein [Anaerolineae bacterium]|nr:FHA domain-containing protein [Anaerolineae bacterium]